MFFGAPHHAGDLSPYSGKCVAVCAGGRGRSTEVPFLAARGLAASVHGSMGCCCVAACAVGLPRPLGPGADGCGCQWRPGHRAHPAAGGAYAAARDWALSSDLCASVCGQWDRVRGSGDWGRQ
eukprot:3448293-Prymnesium_polylepis.1